MIDWHKITECSDDPSYIYSRSHKHVPIASLAVIISAKPDDSV